MSTENILADWFRVWETGDFQKIPVTENFRHTSPYGTISGKKEYLDLVEANRDKFLGHLFEVHDQICDQDKACVRYTAIQGDFRLEVSEWHYLKEGLINEIVAYYNIPGEVREDRRLSDTNGYEKKK